MDLFKAIRERRSVRKFKREPVDDGDLKKILEAGRLAPSGHNRQPWYFIVVRNSETKRELAVAANNQYFIADADVVIAALGDPGEARLRLDASLRRIPHKQDPMIAIEHMVLAATALGYGTCWIGAFDEEEVKRILKVPERLAVIALLPVGVPDENPPPKPRKPFKEIFFRESYGTPLEL
ncbi:nitroreductase [Candidatus Bathyarchaeota archaeon]|nr:MAG: nitroreductase [Candidatus Bathyarchaeota archaeon]